MKAVHETLSWLGSSKLQVVVSGDILAEVVCRADRVGRDDRALLEVQDALVDLRSFVNLLTYSPAILALRDRADRQDPPDHLETKAGPGNRAETDILVLQAEGVNREHLVNQANQEHQVDRDHLETQLREVNPFLEIRDNQVWANCQQWITEFEAKIRKFLQAIQDRRVCLGPLDHRVVMEPRVLLVRRADRVSQANREPLDKTLITADRVNRAHREEVDLACHVTSNPLPEGTLLTNPIMTNKWSHFDALGQ